MDGADLIGLRGDVNLKDDLIRRLIGAGYEHWIADGASDMRLYEWLGLTRDEYLAFVKGGVAAMVATQLTLAVPS